MLQLPRKVKNCQNIARSIPGTLRAFLDKVASDHDGFTDELM